jgi:hypothetical protein
MLLSGRRPKNIMHSSVGTMAAAAREGRSFDLLKLAGASSD